jgi:hypothetical protein
VTILNLKLNHCRAKSNTIHFVALRNTAAIFCILNYANQVGVLKPIYEFSYVVYNRVLEDWRMIQLCTNERSLGRSGWPCGLRRRYSDPRLLGSRVRIPLMAWMIVSCVLCAKRTLRRDDRSSRANLPDVYMCV